MPRHRRPTRDRVSSLLRAEWLEPRVVLSATVEFDAARRVLAITGSDADDAVEVRQQGREITVSIDGVLAMKRSVRGVRVVMFKGFAGDDSMVNDSRLRLVADGGEGEDTLRGGSLDDRIVGGPGRDTIRGEGGNDLLQGGDDDDSIRGGSGRDRLWGDGGDDGLDGGEDRDLLHGGEGLDVEDDFNDSFRDGDRDRDGYDDDHDRPVDTALVMPVTFDADRAAVLSGPSSGTHERTLYGFTAVENGTLTVSLDPDEGGRYPEVELRDMTAGRELLDLEPHDNGAVSGTVPVFAGTSYILRVKPSSHAMATHAVRLAITVSSSTPDTPPTPVSPPIGSPTIGTAIALDADGRAQISGTSGFEDDRQFYSFTAPATGILTVSIAPGANGLYAELEVKDQLTRRELLKLEPHERPTQTSGRIAVTSGRTYVLKIESPFERSGVDFTVDLAIA